MLNEIVRLFGLPDKDFKAEPIGTGLIHHTWKITTGGKAYVLQQINSKVFQCPEDIMENVQMIEEHLQRHYPSYPFVAPLALPNGKRSIYLGNSGYYRMFSFVEGSQTKEVVKTAEEAYEAALQFGRFTRLLSGFNSTSLHATIPCFHDLGLRYQHFLQAVESSDRDRRSRAGLLIKKIVSHSGIVSKYQQIIQDSNFKLRVTHHDTKISNVLFDSGGHGLCVIDLDTVMPGYFISDVGDMMRTYLPAVSEEETNLEMIDVREDIYRAIVKGYEEEMKDELSDIEQEHFFYAGQFMIYMQSMRFLTDYLQKDRYYGEKYPGHNLLRAQNQMVLLERLLDKENLLTGYY